MVEEPDVAPAVGASPTLGLGLSLVGIRSPQNMLHAAVRAEELGFDSVWSFEAWGSDAFTPLAAISARTSRIKLGTGIAGISGRTPGMTVMTALTMQALSGGRLQLGLGVSGPQVVEGWHGVPFGPPLGTMREYVAVLRTGLAAQEKLDFHGAFYDVPFRGDGASGLGKPLRSTLPGHPETPLLIAAIGPQNVAMAVEIADGLLPYLWSSTHWRDAWGASLSAAAADFQVAPTVYAAIGDDLDACRNAVRPHIALHVGGMGSRDKNFYKDVVVRYGYVEEAQLIQDLFLEGRRDEAAAAVSDELVDDLSLVGPVDRVSDQVDTWRDSPVTSMIIEPVGLTTLELLAEIWAR